MNQEELLAGYILGDLDPEEQQRFMALLRENPAFSQEVEQLQETLDSLPYILEEPEPNPQLKDIILATAGSASPERKPPRLRLVTPTWLAIAASVAAVFLGWDSYQMRQALTVSQTQLTQQVAITQMLRTAGTRLVTFEPKDTKMGATGSMVVTPGDKQSVLVLRSVTPPATGQVYRLWATVEGKKRICGEFIPNEKGDVWVKVPVDTNLATMPLIVTLESINAPMEATGPMILTSSS